MKEYNETQERSVYFDVDSCNVPNGSRLEDFHQRYDNTESNNFEWHTAKVTLQPFDMNDNLVLKLRDGSIAPIAAENVDSIYAPIYEEPIHLTTMDKDGNEITEVRSPNYLLMIRLKSGKRYIVKGQYAPERKEVVIIAEEATDSLKEIRNKIDDIQSVLAQLR